MKNKFLRFFLSTTLLFFIGISSLVAKTMYISPNNDGIQDELIIPLQIQDKRFVVEWNLVITDEWNTVVRKIGNKEKRPEKLTFKSFFTQLGKKKEGVLIPEQVIWNGILDSGEVAPDGVYYYYVEAKDDNENYARTAAYTVIVDNTAPIIDLQQPAKSARIFGAGNKPTIKFTQKGSIEDLWTAQIVDTDEKIVRTLTWQDSPPETWAWDGKNDEGVAVKEGVYTYTIFAIDKAGNKSPQAQVGNIIYDAIPRSIDMVVKGSPFSPNGDGVKDTLTIIPSMSSTDGLLNWSIDVKNAGGSSVYTIESVKAPPATISFEGKDSSGTVLSDGEYQLDFFASFSNGQESRIARKVLVDNTPPSAMVKTDGSIFSPDGDGRLDIITIHQEGSKEKSWEGRIVNEAGAVVKQWTYGEVPPTSIEWDGVSLDGKITDGFYKYELASSDLAGNSVLVATTPFELNTGATEVIVTVSPDAFSPNGDKVQDTIKFTPQIRTESGIASYELKIIDELGTVVKTFAEKRSIPASISWNGLTDDGSPAKDGTYSAVLSTVSKNGSEAEVNTRAFVLDTSYPELTISTDYDLFSPNGDGNKDMLPLAIKTSDELHWQAQIKDKNNIVVRTFSWEGAVPSFDWDGKDETGNVVSDGTYSFVIGTTDKAGNKTEKTIKNIQVDNRVPIIYVTAEHDAFSPNGDGLLDEQLFSIRSTLNEGIEYWTLSIVDDATGEVYRSWNQNDYANIPETIEWDGRKLDGTAVEGVLVGKLNIKYVKGDDVSQNTTSFLCAVTPPELTVRTAPEYFSPDNDGVDDDMFINLQGKSIVPFESWSFEIRDPKNGSSFWKTSGTSSISEKIVWDGRGNNGELVQSAVDYPYEFIVKDILGMESKVTGLIPVDVLVIRIGDVLKIQVPSIIFRSDNADFVGKDEDPERGLDQEVIDNNIRVLKRIAYILNKFEDYKVTIEGHANNLTGTEAEETSTAGGNIPLVPLSEARANTVQDMLISYGVNKNRLTTVGRGGRMPIAARSDRANWWKNRRVEFILNK